MLPLNQYQMDLVENREKYEEKLRAVEQSFEYDDQDPEDSKAEVLRQERPYAVPGTGSCRQSGGD